MTKSVNKIETKIENPFKENPQLESFVQIKIISPNSQTDTGPNNQNNNQKANENQNAVNNVVNNLLTWNNPDSVYNFKKDFLVLAFDQKEDQNSLEYKIKTISEKLMSDVTFSLNKAFEFSFEDKIKNNIIVTLSKNSREEIYNENTSLSTQSLRSDTRIDNNYILDLCNNNISIETNDDNLNLIEKWEGRENFLGYLNTKEELDNSIIEDQVTHAQRTYMPYDAISIVYNEQSDEEFDVETYDFFVNFVEQNHDRPIAAKVRIVLNFIDDVHPKTMKPVFTNKEKNQLLRNWKMEYDVEKAKADKRAKEWKKLQTKKSSTTLVNGMFQYSSRGKQIAPITPRTKARAYIPNLTGTNFESWNQLQSNQGSKRNSGESTPNAESKRLSTTNVMNIPIRTSIKGKKVSNKIELFICYC